MCVCVFLLYRHARLQAHGSRYTNWCLQGWDRWGCVRDSSGSAATVSVNNSRKKAAIAAYSPSLPLSLCLCFPFAVVGNCFRFPVEWKFAKLTNDCNCVCSSMRVCECVCAPVRVCVTENALYTLGNVRKFNNILIRLHFKGVAPKIFLCLPATP